MSSSPSPSYYSFEAPSPSFRHRRSTSSSTSFFAPSYSSIRRPLLSSPSSSPRPSQDLSSAQRNEIRSKLEPLLFAPPKSILNVAKDLFIRKSSVKGRKRAAARRESSPPLSDEEVQVAKEMYDEWISRYVFPLDATEPSTTSKADVFSLFFLPSF
ncbi:hypothetical protein BDY24DRAFT_417041 [Mrakia frigida]|uniref:uncharacterized protein n=1 Tax=Mrakia frigida TaxID=29902 RepID=UPI003FCC0C86